MFEVGRFIYGSVRKYYYVGISRLRVLSTDLLSGGLTHLHDQNASLRLHNVSMDSNSCQGQEVLALRSSENLVRSILS